MTDDEIRALELRALLRRVRSSAKGWLQARDFRVLLSEKEYAEYRVALASNQKIRSEHSAPSLSKDAKDYWDTFRKLYAQSQIQRSPEQHKRIVDTAVGLIEQFQALSQADRNRFREINLSAGDTRWANAAELLEHEFLILDEGASEAAWLNNLKGFTQERFLEDLIEKLQPTSPSASLVVKASSKEALRKLMKRLNR